MSMSGALPVALAAVGGSAAAVELAVLGADTAVVIDDELLGKPRDRADALAMLARLSGRSHQVLTAVALASRFPCVSSAPFARPVVPLV